MMNKDEILANSRRENENRDPYEMQINNTSCSLGAAVALIFAALINAVQIMSGNGSNAAALMTIFVFNAVCWLYRAVKLGGKTNILIGISWTLCALITTVSAIIQAIGR